MTAHRTQSPDHCLNEAPLGYEANSGETAGKSCHATARRYHVHLDWSLWGIKNGGGLRGQTEIFSGHITAAAKCPRWLVVVDCLLCYFVSWPCFSNFANEIQRYCLKGKKTKTVFQHKTLDMARVPQLSAVFSFPIFPHGATTKWKQRSRDLMNDSSIGRVGEPPRFFCNTDTHRYCQTLLVYYLVYQIPNPFVKYFTLCSPNMWAPIQLFSTLLFLHWCSGAGEWESPSQLSSGKGGVPRTHCQLTARGHKARQTEIPIHPNREQ